jgi:hypothetical protein
MKFYSLYLLAIIIFGIVHCNTKEVKPIQPNFEISRKADSNWGYKGWGGTPEAWKEGKNKDEVSGAAADWFYMIASGKASDRAKELKSPSYMMGTCKVSALQDNIQTLSKEAAFSALEKTKEDIQLQQKAIEVLKNQSKGSVVCKSIGDKEDYTVCDCVIYIKFTGGKKALRQVLETP